MNLEPQRKVFKEEHLVLWFNFKADFTIFSLNNSFCDTGSQCVALGWPRAHYEEVALKSGSVF